MSCTDACLNIRTEPPSCFARTMNKACHLVSAMQKYLHALCCFSLVTQAASHCTAELLRADNSGNYFRLVEVGVHCSTLVRLRAIVQTDGTSLYRDARDRTSSKPRARNLRMEPVNLQCPLPAIHAACPTSRQDRETWLVLGTALFVRSFTEAWSGLVSCVSSEEDCAKLNPQAPSINPWEDDKLCTSPARYCWKVASTSYILLEAITWLSRCEIAYCVIFATGPIPGRSPTKILHAEAPAAL